MIVTDHDHDCPGSRRHERGLQVHDRRADEMSQKLQLLSLNLGFSPTNQESTTCKGKKRKREMRHRGGEEEEEEDSHYDGGVVAGAVEQTNCDIS